MTDIPGNVTTTAVARVGDVINDSLETIGDRDWFRLTLTIGQEVKIQLAGVGPNGVTDTYLRVVDGSGRIIFENDDAGDSPFSSLAFSAPSSGVFFIVVGAFNDAGSGDYQLRVTPYQPPAEATLQQIADQMTNGYWGGASHHFDVTQGGSISVNYGTLPYEEKSLAQAALLEWAKIIGIRFVEVSSGGQIVFEDGSTGAFTSASYSDGITHSAHINVGPEWVRNYGTQTNSYSALTYLHEVGHALGLGHPGNYNDNATFPYDALFLNDSWAASVMSYYSQTQNTFIASKGFDENFPTTPMIADILAMSKLYGIANGPVYDTIYSSFPFYSGAICLFDFGGIDTIDATYQRGNQYISLVPGTYSNINGETGNVSIAFGTIIENAIGGAGNDTLIGNDAANTLTGGEGADTLFGGGAGDYLDGGAGADKLDGGPGDDRIVYDPEDIETQVKGGDGFDTLLVIDRATPYAFNLSRQGFEAAEVTQHYPGGGALSVIRFYTADWALKLLTTNYADLTHVSIQYDPLGVMDTYEVWNSYDADNRLSSTDLIFDNGTRTYINIDEDNSKPYTQDWFNYDAQGRLDSEDYRLDGGAHTFVNFDQANAFSWSQDWFNYDALGRLDSEDLINDNGTHTFINLDQDNSQPWASAWFNYDAQGRLDTSDVRNDDGGHIFYNYDQTNTELFSLTAQIYDPNGRLTQQVVVWDDGSKTYTYF